MKFEVRGESGLYEVCLNPISCTCKDFVFNKGPKGMFCKHIKSLINAKSNREDKDGMYG